jgi:hypothetical protein
MGHSTQRRIAACFCIGAGLTALAVGGLALYIGGGLTLALGLIWLGFA